MLTSHPGHQYSVLKVTAHLRLMLHYYKTKVGFSLQIPLLFTWAYEADLQLNWGKFAVKENT